MMPIEITSAAVAHITKMVSRENKKNVILDIVTGGCNGYEYKWIVTDDALSQDGDVGIRLSEENVLYLSKTTAERMFASIITLTQDGLSKKLDILNPNVAYACGCGESINFK
jgi:iron-sulfur cluster assembly protein